MVTGLLAGCRAAPPGEGFVPATLPLEQYEWVGTLTDLIIPATDSPGAREAGVPANIDRLLTDWYPEADRMRFLAGLATLDAHAQATYGQPGPSLEAEQQTALLAALDQQTFGPDKAATMLPETLLPFYRWLKELTVAGYYTSEVGATQELRVNPMGVYLADIPYADIGHVWA